jgi:aldose sugar dehydrogenase
MRLQIAKPFGRATRLRRPLKVLGVCLVLLTGVLVGDYLSDIKALTVVRSWYGRPSRNRRSGAAAGRWQDLRTNLHHLEYFRIPLRPIEPVGGAVDEIDGSILFATSLGEIGYLSPEGALIYLPQRIPMNREGIDAHPISNDPRFNSRYIRVTDILVQARTPAVSDLYVGHHYFRGDCIEWRLSRIGVAHENGALRIVDDARWDTLFVAKPCVSYVNGGAHAFPGHFAGGRIVALDRDTLLISFGDYEFDGKNGDPKVSMDPGASLGKIVKLSISTGNAEVYATGLRNPQGLLIDSRGRLWETEHGPQGGDELNLIEQGRNYGWPEVTLGVDYGYVDWAEHSLRGRHEGYTMPRHAWTPSIGISNLIEADATEFPYWAGDLIVASLRENTLFHLRLDGDRVVYSEPIRFAGDRLRDVISMKDGRIVLLTDAPDLLIVRNKERGTGEDGMVRPDSRVEMAGTRASGPDVFKARCAACHGPANVKQAGPTLSGVVGRRVGSVEGFGYSSALRNADQRWSKELLQTFLEDPQAAFPGTMMSVLGLSAQERRALVEYLATWTGAR